MGLSVLPVEERLLGYRVTKPGLGPVERRFHVALAVGGHAEQVADFVGGADSGDHDVGPLAQSQPSEPQLGITAQPCSEMSPIQS